MQEGGAICVTMRELQGDAESLMQRPTPVYMHACCVRTGIPDDLSDDAIPMHLRFEPNTGTYAWVKNSKRVLIVFWDVREGSVRWVDQ